MKKLVRSRAGCRSPRPSISIRVRPIEMSKWPASSNTVQCGRSGSTGTSSVDVSHSGPARLRNTVSIRVSSSASVSIVVSYEPMPTFYHLRRPVSGALTGHNRRKVSAAPVSGPDPRPRRLR